MSKNVVTTYYCDNTRYCSSEAISQDGLPIGWISMTQRLKDRKALKIRQIHRQYCTLRCLMQAEEEIDESRT